MISRTSSGPASMSVLQPLSATQPPPPPIRRSFPPWIRYPALALLYGVGVPIAKTLELFGLWPPRIAPHRRHHAFGDYRPSAHDVFACSYMKSGTNWLLQIAVQIAHRGHAQFDNIRDMVSWPDSPSKSFGFPSLMDTGIARQCPTGLRVIKTHLSFHDIPYSNEARYVALVRDPKDVFVSSYHFVRAMLMGPMMPSVAHWLDLFLSSRFPQGSWPVHLDSYWRVRERDNVLFLTYETLQSDLAATVRRIADFMRVSLSAAELEGVVHQSSFAHMKQLGPVFEPPMLTPWSTPRGAVVRSGRRGNSRELLTPAQQRRIDEHCRAQLVQLGCDFPYDEVYGGG